MMQRIQRIVLSMALIVSGFGVAAAVPAATASAAACTSSFLTFPAWYDGLLDGDCKVVPPSTVDTQGGVISTFIFRIVLNIIEIVLQIIAYAAAGYIIYGGFKYLTSAGQSDRIQAGRKIIQNALVGLVISFMSVAIVNLISVNVGLTGNGGACNAASTTVDPDCVGVAKIDADKAVDGILNTVYFAAGTAAVIVMIICGILYTTSQGDSSKIQQAKNGILYSVVGLIIVMIAFVITNFVIGRF